VFVVRVDGDLHAVEIPVDTSLGPRDDCLRVGVALADPGELVGVSRREVFADGRFDLVAGGLFEDRVGRLPDDFVEAVECRKLLR
jgi:hypothetical protein